MDLNIILLLNNITDFATINNGIVILKAKLPFLKLNITQRLTTKQFTSISSPSEANANGFVVNPVEIFQEAKTLEIPFDVCMLNFDSSKIQGGTPTNPCDTGQDIQMAFQWFVTYPEVWAEFTLHELCHYFFARFGKPDITHLLTDGNLQKQNVALYDKWKQLQPIDYYAYLISTFMPPQIPTVTLTRLTDDGKETRGNLIYGTFTCKTLERPWLDDQANISNIPKGTYLCQYNFSLTQLGWTYELQNVPNRGGIRIHSGNFFTDTEGCILLGSAFEDINGDGELDVINSRVTVNAFVKLLNKQPFTLVIQ